MGLLIIPIEINRLGNCARWVRALAPATGRPSGTRDGKELWKAKTEQVPNVSERRLCESGQVGIYAKLIKLSGSRTVLTCLPEPTALFQNNNNNYRLSPCRFSYSSFFTFPSLSLARSAAPPTCNCDAHTISNYDVFGGRGGGSKWLYIVLHETARLRARPLAILQPRMSGANFPTMAKTENERRIFWPKTTTANR